MDRKNLPNGKPFSSIVIQLIIFVRRGGRKYIGRKLTFYCTVQQIYNQYSTSRPELHKHLVVKPLVNDTIALQPW